MRHQTKSTDRPKHVEVTVEDRLRLLACTNPTLISSELVVLAGTVPAVTKQEQHNVSQVHRRQRTAMSS